MRLTTKIIIGAILSIFSISLLLIIGFSFTDRKNHRSSVNFIQLPQENPTGIELGSFKTITIDKEPYETNEYNIYLREDDCNLYIDSTPEQNNPDMLFIPESLKDYISTGITGDTLNIRLKIWDLHNKYKSDKYRSHSVAGINLHFTLSKIDIINKLHDLSIQVKNIETDSVKINSRGSIYIDSCKINVITPVIKTEYYNKKLTITNCEAKKVNLDLDNSHRWNFENCNIEEENLTGSHIHNITQNESGKINWLPKNKDATLNITVQGDTTQIIFNTPRSNAESVK